jgi:large subunit ribosomal protein L10
MSKYVKNLIADHLRGRLKGVNEALLVNIVGLGANANNKLRNQLKSKNIQLVVVKNSQAARAVADTPLAPLLDGVGGCAGICWGAEDIVALAKEVVRLAKTEEFAPFKARGGVMEGAPLSSTQVEEVSRWPSREEQLSLLVGQILGPGARLAAQLLGPGGRLASQIEEKSKDGAEEGGEGEPAPAAPE